MKPKSIKELHQTLLNSANSNKAKIYQRFFKTGKGEYGEGDIFLGLTVPETRTIVNRFKDLPFSEILKSLKSKYHEERLIGLLLLVFKFQKGSEEDKITAYEMYINNTRYINNWDLVDVTAEKIIGPHLENKDKSLLYKFAKSKNLWDRRIAIMSTFHYIKKGNPSETLKIAKMLLNDKADLIHKAVGWMLREVGKRCGEEVEEKFLKRYYQTMPRTMLRYAIERFPEKKRKAYLAKKLQ